MDDTRDRRREVFDGYRDGRLPLDARGVGYLLGYQFAVERDRRVAFDVGSEGPVSTTFTPTVDLLVTGLPPEGFVVVGPGEDGVATREAVYDGLGRAVALLSLPLTEDGGVFGRVSLAGPFPEGDGEVGEDVSADAETARDLWWDGVVAATRATPVGLVSVDAEGIDTVVAPDPNPLYDQRLVEGVLGGLADQYEGAQDPEGGLASRAEEIDEDQPASVE